MRLLLTALIFCLMSSQAWACYVRPPEHIIPANLFIEKAENIVLAKVINAKRIDDGVGAGFGNYSMKYDFEVLTRIKGEFPKNSEHFSIDGEPSNGETEHFDDHKDKDFWADGGGRMFNYPDCNIYPNFRIGETYLVFPDLPLHAKSFELIREPPPVDKVPNPDTTDDWLIYVLEKVTKTKSQTWWTGMNR